LKSNPGKRGPGIVLFPKIFDWGGRIKIWVNGSILWVNGEYFKVNGRNSKNSKINIADNQCFIFY